jgi:hypothetical protein
MLLNNSREYFIKGNLFLLLPVKPILLGCFLFVALFSYTQKPEFLDFVKDTKTVGEFTVRLRLAPANTFLFDILKDNKPIGFHPNNPATMLPIGFDKKEDAFKVAEWQIKEYRKTGHFMPFVPPHIARELNIPVFKPHSIPNTNP